MRVNIMYVTFRRDLAWLDVSMRSFKKYCSGFTGVTIVVPTSDLDVFLPFEAKYSTKDCPVLVKTFLEFPGKGFCHHMAMICYADVFATDATHVLHIDPDCLWNQPTTPYEYVVDEKPVLVIEPFDAIRQAGHMGRYGWKKPVDDALKIDTKYETMCRHGATHPKWLYKSMREHIEARHCVPFIDYVLRQQNSFPQSFVEFDTLGAYAVEFYPSKYKLIDRGYDGERNDPVPHITQMWANHSEPSDTHNQVNIQRILG